MKEISFDVQGSAVKPYEVVFKLRDETNLSAYCSCPAGQNGSHCKHRVSILDGHTKAIVSSNADEVKIVQSWLIGSDVETALIKMRRLDILSEKVKKDLSASKKALARTMLD